MITNKDIKIISALFYEGREAEFVHGDNVRTIGTIHTVSWHEYFVVRVDLLGEDAGTYELIHFRDLKSFTVICGE